MSTRPQTGGDPSAQTAPCIATLCSKNQKALNLMKEMSYEHTRHIAAQKAAIAEARARSSPRSSPPKLADGLPFVPPLKLTPGYEAQAPRWGLRSQFTWRAWQAFKKKQVDEKEAHEAAAARALAKQRQAKLAIQKEARAQAARAHAQELIEASEGGEGGGDEGMAKDGRLAACVNLSCLNALSPNKQQEDVVLGGNAAGGKNMPQSEAVEGHRGTVLDGSPPPKQTQREVGACVMEWSRAAGTIVPDSQHPHPPARRRLHPRRRLQPHPSSPHPRPLASSPSTGSIACSRPGGAQGA